MKVIIQKIHAGLSLHRIALHLFTLRTFLNSLICKRVLSVNPSILIESANKLQLRIP